MPKYKRLYWWLIGTFTVLYLAIAFVSTLHAITFFQLANNLALAILLGAAYEIGQASVLFSILMTENKNKILAWSMMFLLTGLQVSANVFASFKFMDASGSNDWTYWQRAILFGVQADSPEMYKVIISWISGALLPIVALGMTALVADQIQLAHKEKHGIKEEKIKEEKTKKIIENEVQKKINKEEDYFELETDIKKEKKDKLKNQLKKTAKKILPDFSKPLEYKIVDETKEKIESINTEEILNKPVNKPVNKIRGWHLMNEFVDNNHNIFQKGKFIGNNPTRSPTELKKV